MFCMEKQQADKLDNNGGLKQGEQEVTYEEFFNGLIVNNTIDENASGSRKVEGVLLNPFGQNLLCYTWIDAESPEAKLESMQDLIEIYGCMGWSDPDTDRDNKRKVVADLRTLQSKFFPQMKTTAQITVTTTLGEMEQLLAKLTFGESFVNESLAQKEQELASLEAEWALSDFYGTRAQALNDFQPKSAFQKDLINFLQGKKIVLDGGYHAKTLQVKTFEEITSVDQLKGELRTVTRYYKPGARIRELKSYVKDVDTVLDLVNNPKIEPWVKFTAREDQLEKKPWNKLGYDDVVDICVRVLIGVRGAADNEIRNLERQETTLPGGIKNPFS